MKPISMIPILCFLAVTAHASPDLKAKDVLFAPSPQLLKVVGKVDPSAKREMGMTLMHPGYTRVWINGAGPGMKGIKFCLAKLIPYKSFLSQLGLGTAHISASAQPVPASPIPLLRNKFELKGVSGLPAGWTVTVLEYAIVNKAKLREMKPQIVVAAPGVARASLIRSCYDWYSEVDLTRS